MSPVPERKDTNDELLNKLDGLMRSGRSPRPQNAPPVLTEAVAPPPDATIPTLTDAVDGEQPAGEPAPEQDTTSIEQTVAWRLVSSIDREMADLSRELPQHRLKLAVLHRSLRFALPELVRLRWQAPPPESGDDTD